MSSLLRSAVVAVLGVTLVAAGLYLWQREGASAHNDFANLGQFRAAFARVVPGMPASRLPRLGFDRTRPGARTLSYLGAMEFFMPNNSRDFDRLDPAILTCLAAEDRCGAYVFRFDSGTPEAGLFDFAAHAAQARSQRVVFLVKSGRIAYKAMTGR